MTTIKIDSYSVKKSKSGHYTPIINGIHIHSSYNPTREADSFIEKNEELIQEKPNLLIFGLGFGYHINLAAKLLKKSNHRHHHIVVIEPNKRTHSDCRNLNLIDYSGCIIHSGETIESLYENKDLVDFLLKSPSILAHPASFNLYSDYFKDFLSYRAPRNISNLRKKLSLDSIRSYFESKDMTGSIDDFLNIHLPQQRIFESEEDHLLIAFRNMTKAKVLREQT